MGVAFGMETASVVGVERVGMEGLGFLLVHVIELCFETELMLKFFKVIQETAVVKVDEMRLGGVLLVLGDQLDISMGGGRVAGTGLGFGGFIEKGFD